MFFTQLLELPADRKAAVLGCAVNHAENLLDRDPAFQWIVRLNRIYPGDIGVLAPALLNLVTLEPGQALFLPAKTLHAYLHGTGLEVMASSDNVLRGGLTAKHVDSAELVRILSFEPMTPQGVIPVAVSDCEVLYPVPSREFGLSVIDAGKGPCLAESHGSAEIILCVGGTAVVTEERTGDVITLQSGASAFVPACTGRYKITGDSRIFRAFIPA